MPEARWHEWVRSLGVVVALATCLACGAGPSASAAPPRPRTVDLSEPGAVKATLQPGEWVEGRIRFAGMVVARGRAWVASARGRGSAVELHLEGHSTGLVAQFRRAVMHKVTIVDSETGFPRRYRNDVELGSKQRRYDVFFGPGRFRYEFSRSYDRTVRGVARLPTGQRAHDAFSAVLMVRGWHPHPGTRGRLYLAVERRLWQVDVVCEGPVQLVQDRKAVRAVAYSGLAKKLHPKPHLRIERRFRVWFSDDVRHLPLRAVVETRYGEVELELVSYSPSNPPTQRDGSHASTW